MCQVRCPMLNLGARDLIDTYTGFVQLLVQGGAICFMYSSPEAGPVRQELKRAAQLQGRLEHGLPLPQRSSQLNTRGFGNIWTVCCSHSLLPSREHPLSSVLQHLVSRIDLMWQAAKMPFWRSPCVSLSFSSF